MTIKVIGLDIAKNVFQAHGVDETGSASLRRRLRRSEVLEFFGKLPPALVGVEACHTAHYWAREIAALGHDVRLMPPQFVKPYVKSQKNDMADAEAICEAVQRPSMRFVPIKSAESQAALLLHRTRDLLIRQRSAMISAIRAHFAEFGIVVGGGIRNVDRLLGLLEAESGRRLPTLAGAGARDARRPGRPAAGARGAGRGGRRAAVRMASQPAGQSAAGDHPRRGSDHRERDRRHSGRPAAVPIRPPLRGMARARAATALQRRAGVAGSDLEAGRRLCPAAARARGAGGCGLDRQVVAAADALARASARASAHERRDCRLREQACAHRLGGHDARNDFRFVTRLRRRWLTGAQDDDLRR
jgi:transposase